MISGMLSNLNIVLISGERDQGALHEQRLQARPDRRVHRRVRGAQRLVRQSDQDQDHLRRLERGCINSTEIPTCDSLNLIAQSLRRSI